MTVDFTTAQRAIGAFLERVGDPDGLTDVHVRGGIVSTRRRGLVEEIAFDEIDPDPLVAEIANCTATAMRREISAKSPILEQRIPPRYRVTCSHPSIMQDGRWAMALRLLATETIPLEKWVDDGAMDEATAARLIEIVEHPTTVLIAGTIGAGKTTLLRTLLGKLPVSQRMLVIEDAAELNIDRPNTVAMSTAHAADLTALIAHGFRLDADRIVVGEVRDHAAMQFLTLAAGGSRAMTTIHAEPGVGALVRLHQLVQQSGYRIDMAQIEAAIHAVVTVRRLIDGGRKVELWQAA